jgi:predicted XRE-type DNA-binding protein
VDERRKPFEFVGSSLADLKFFPDDARSEAGHQLSRVQLGLDPADWKAMPTVGSGAYEIRVRDGAGAFRVIYVALRGQATGGSVRAALLLKEDPEDERGRRRSCQPALQGVAAMIKERFASVWDAIEDTPAHASNMKLRSDMMIVLTSYIERTGMTQAQAAKLFGVTQPRISDLKRGKVSLFSLDTLVNMLAAAGIRVRMEVDAPEAKATRPPICFNAVSCVF